jgi:xanthosine utilization system XapX-like protein
MVPALYYAFTVLDFDIVTRMHLSVGTSLAIIIPTSIISTKTHMEYDAVDFKMVKSFGIFILLGVIAGTFLAVNLKTPMLVLFFSIFAFRFSGPRSAVFIFQSVAITGILALGVTCTLVVDGFDLSIGSVATSSLMMSAYMLVILEQNAFVAVMSCLLMGAFVGLINGLLIVKMKVPDLLATLGMMFLLIGLQRVPTEGRSIATGMRLPSGEVADGIFPGSFLWIGRHRFDFFLEKLIPVPVIIFLAVAIDLPSVGTRCNPIRRNIIPSVASKSGTFILTIKSPFIKPTNAPIKRHDITATNAFCSRITSMYADIIKEEVATEPIERSKPSTTNVHVTPNARIPVMATD